MRAINDISWPIEFMEMKRIEDLMLCGICYEYLQTSMMAPCSHNYCSLCIRKYLHYKTECPSCFKQTYEKDLRTNRTLDELIESYLKIRDKLGLCINRNKNISSGDIKSSLDVRSPPVRPARNSQLTKTPKSSSIQITPLKDRNEVKVSNEPISEKKVTNSPLAEVKIDPLPEKTASVNAKIVSSPSTSRGNQKISAFFSSPSNTTTSVINNKTVACPVCNVEVSEKFINRHLDDCLKRQTVSKEEKKTVEKRKPLTKLVLSVMKEHELRKKLKELGLSAQGDRRTLESRYHRYTILYNSECDKDNPRPVNELIKLCEHDEMQELKLKRMTEMGIKLQVNKNTSQNLIEEEQRKYLDKNKSSFQSLVEDIKRRQANAKSESSSVATTNNLTKEDETSNISVPSDDGQFVAIDEGDSFNDSDSSICPLQRYNGEFLVRCLNTEAFGNEVDDSLKPNEPLKQNSPVNKISPVKCNSLEKNTAEMSPVKTESNKSSKMGDEEMLASTPSSSICRTKSVYDQTTDSDSNESEEDIFETSPREDRPMNKKLKLSNISNSIRRSLDFRQDEIYSSDKANKQLEDHKVDEAIIDEFSVNDDFSNRSFKGFEEKEDLTEIVAQKIYDTPRNRSLRKRNRSSQNSGETSNAEQVDTSKKVLHENNNNPESSACEDTAPKRRLRGRPRRPINLPKETENLPKRPLRKGRSTNSATNELVSK